MAGGGLGHSIMPKQKLQQLVWPTKGITEQRPYTGQYDQFTLDALNVRNFDVLGERLRGGQRTGQTKLVDSRVNGSSAIQNLTQATEAVPLSVDAGLGNRLADPSTSLALDNGFDLDFHPDGDYIALVGDDTGGADPMYGIYAFDKNSGAVGSLVASDDPGSGRARTLVWTNAGDYLLVGDSAGSVHVMAFDAAGGSVTATNSYSLGSSDCSQIALHPDDTYLAVAFDGGIDEVAVFAFDPSNGVLTTTAIQPGSLPGAAASGVSWHPDGDYLAAAFDSEDLPYAWPFDATNGSFGSKVADPTRAVPSGDGVVKVAFNPAGTYLAILGLSRTVHAYPWSGSFGVPLDSDWDTSAGVSPTRGNPLTWSPSGDFLMVTRGQDGNGSNANRIGIFPFNAGFSAVLADASTATDDGFKEGGAWHPDETFISYGHNTSPYFSVYEFTTATTNPSALRTRVVAVAGGGVYRSDSAVTVFTQSNQGAGKLRADNLRVGASVAFQNLFFCDGRKDGYHYLDFSDNTVKDWAANLNAGSLPTDSGNTQGCRLTTTYRGRVVLAGLESDPQNWFMSKAGDPFDFNYSPATPSQTQAVAGNNSTAGKVGQEITALAPFQDDLMIMAGRSTLWVMRGDPAAGGQIDNVSRSVGIVGPEAFAWTSTNIFYFFGLNGLYRMAPNSMQPEHVSVGRLDTSFSQIDTANDNVRLIYDPRWQGVHIFVTPIEEPSVQRNHWWYDERTDSFWRDKYPNAHGPTAIEYFSADTPDRRGVILGGFDGYIRRFDDGATDDDGTAIRSNVLLPPIQPGGVSASTRLDDTYILTDVQSDDLTMRIYADYSTEAAYDDYLNNNFKVAQTIRGGQNNPIRQRVAQNSFLVQLEQTADKTTWAFEAGQTKHALLNRMKGKRVT